MQRQLAERSSGHLRIVSSPRRPTNRQALAERMEALANDLRALSEEEDHPVPTETALLGLATKVYSSRRFVDTIFGIPGFAVSPGWDIMLDLYKSKVLGKQISVTSACIGGACAATTGLRWLQVLEGMQLIERQADQKDKRRSAVEITESGKIKVEQALAKLL